MRHYEATDRHRHRPHGKRPGCDSDGCTCGNVLRGEIEEQVHEAKSEKRDMAEPVEASFMAGIAAQPVLSMKVEAEKKARTKTEKGPEPGQHEVNLNGFSVHLFGLLE